MACAATPKHTWPKKTIFLFAKLLVQQWNVVIVFGLVQIASNWSAQIVLLSQFSDGKVSAIGGAGVGQARLIEINLAILLVNQVDIAMQASTWWRA